MRGDSVFSETSQDSQRLLVRAAVSESVQKATECPFPQDFVVLCCRNPATKHIQHDTSLAIVRKWHKSDSAQLDRGCPDAVYWQFSCNEARRRPVDSSDDVRGFRLIRPDGTKTPA